MLKKIISVGVLLLMGMCFFCGCVEDKPQGTFYSLQEAYEQGLLTQEDIRSIAYYYYDGMEYVFVGVDKNEDSIYDLQTTGYVPIPKKPEILSTETEKAVKESGAAIYRAQTFPDGTKIYPEARAKGFTVTQYYGTYDDCVAISLTESYSNKFDSPAGAPQPVFIELAEVVFVSIPGSIPNISIWKQK